MADLVTYEQADGVVHIHMDDGKVNVMSAAMLDALHVAFDRAATDGAAAVVLSGRSHVFSAGFDLKVLQGGAAAEVYAMLRAGAELALKILAFPAPVITVTEGHAYPMGAFLMLAADMRLGAEGDWRVGLNEVRIGIAPPRFAVEVARQRLVPAYFSRTAVTGEMFGPAEAKAAGFIDQLVARQGLPAAVKQAVETALSLHPASHRLAKQRARGEVIARMREVIDADITLDYAHEVVARRVA